MKSREQVAHVKRHTTTPLRGPPSMSRRSGTKGNTTIHAMASVMLPSDAIFESTMLPSLAPDAPNKLACTAMMKARPEYAMPYTTERMQKPIRMPRGRRTLSLKKGQCAKRVGSRAASVLKPAVLDSEARPDSSSRTEAGAPIARAR